MKKGILITVILLLLPLIIKADPPKKINISCTVENKTLIIDVFHPVQNVEKHYIDLISISINGKEVKKINFSRQSDKKGEKAELTIPEITSGCKITVRASCNEFGSKSVSKKI